MTKESAMLDEENGHEEKEMSAPLDRHLSFSLHSPNEIIDKFVK